jgi:hypothetical protein
VVRCGVLGSGTLAVIEARNTRRSIVPRQITYKYLPPEFDAAVDDRSEAEPVRIRRVEEGAEMPHHEAGDVVQLPDLRYGDEERSFKVVMVSPIETNTRFGAEGSGGATNRNVFVTDSG